MSRRCDDPVLGVFTEPSHVVEKKLVAMDVCSSGREIEPPTLHGRSSIGEVVHAALAASVEEIVRLDSCLRLNVDVEGVHEARVAVRRLRSHLRSFLPVLDAESANVLGERLSWLQDHLSAVRDADVLIAGIHQLAACVPDADQSTIERVLQPFHEKRRRGYDDLRAMLHGERYTVLLRDFVDTARQPPLKTPCASEPARAIVPAILSDAWSTLRKRVRRRSDPPSDRELHAIRIAAKRVRYLGEALIPVAGSPARRFASSAERLQTVLGRQHDAVLAREQLRTIASDPGRAFIAGELAVRAHDASLASLGGWAKAWRKLRRCRRRLSERLGKKAATR